MIIYSIKISVDKTDKIRICFFNENQQSHKVKPINIYQDLYDHQQSWRIYPTVHKVDL